MSFSWQGNSCGKTSCDLEGSGGRAEGLGWMVRVGGGGGAAKT